MFASRHPLEDTLVLEIPRSEILELHGQLVQAPGSDLGDRLMSAIETFNAHLPLDRFARQEPV